MAVQAQSPIAAQPPPPLPYMPDVSTTLSNYLQQFSSWCLRSFGGKLNANTALPGILLQASDAAAGVTPKVFLIHVNSAGTITATLVAPGGANPGI